MVERDLAGLDRVFVAHGPLDQAAGAAREIVHQLRPVQSDPSGIDDDATLRANREGFRKFQLRPRRLVDVTSIDMSCELLGIRYDSPIVLAPTGSNQAFHPSGELAPHTAILGNRGSLFLGYAKSLRNSWG